MLFRHLSISRTHSAFVANVFAKQKCPFRWWLTFKSFLILDVEALGLAGVVEVDGDGGEDVGEQDLVLLVLLLQTLAS